MKYIILIFLIVAVAKADYIGITLENDFPFNTDRYYTHGWSLNYNTQKDIFNLSNEQFSVLLNKFSLRQEIYTPDNRNSLVFIDNDYPYNGLIYLKQTSFIRYSENISFDLSAKLGFVGELAQAKKTQKAIHSITASSLNPNGWHNQQANDLLFNIDFNLNYYLFNNKYFDIISSVGSQLGSEINSVNSDIKINIYPIVLFNSSNNIFFSFNTKAIYQFYNGKLQGINILSNSTGLKESQIVNLFNHTTLSFGISIYEIILTVKYNYLSKQIYSQNKHQYITMNILFEI